MTQLLRTPYGWPRASCSFAGRFPSTKNIKPFIEKSMKDQPMATLAVAAAIGLVLGAIWKK